MKKWVEWLLFNQLAPIMGREKDTDSAFSLQIDNLIVINERSVFVVDWSILCQSVIGETLIYGNARGERDVKGLYRTGKLWHLNNKSDNK